jgi:hypothetical protein
MPEPRKTGERYEPMPDITRLPAWLWRRTPPAVKAALVVALLALIGVAIAIGPDIQRSKSERERGEQRERADARAEREREIHRTQQPIAEAGRPAGENLAARRRLLAAARTSMLDDARRRVAARELRGPIGTVQCEPFPRSVNGIGAESQPDKPIGRYACLAVTARFERSEASTGGRIGHPYRLRIDFDSGRYAFCKIVGRPGEGQLRRHIGPTVPRVCGGGP